MTSAQLQTIEKIFHAALEQEPAGVTRFVEEACAGDELLRRKVEALLASHEQSADFIETSAVGITTRVMENRRIDLLIGRTIGHYKILRPIGAGGMGEVYLATDVTAGRKAALKLLATRYTRDAERLRRFRQEARAVVALNHPNILTVYEIGEDNSTHYIASELIEGETLRQRLARGPIPLREAVDIAIQMASAVAAAHAAGIVHRDINPGNIMLRPDGYVKVLDFGIAKLAEEGGTVTASSQEALLPLRTNLGSLLGTVPYMSPEQARGEPVDNGTDIWSLGVVLYEMVTGLEPFNGAKPREVITSILEKEPLPLASYIPRSPAELQQILSKTLRKDQGKRCRDADEILQALNTLRRKLEFEAESTKAMPWLSSTKARLALALLLLLVALALAVPFYRPRNPTTSTAPEKSIAVLPLENLSDDKENAYFADGIQDEVLSRLSKIKDLKVTSRTSAMQYKSGTTRNLKEIGQQLGVTHVLEGDVRRAGQQVRVSVQLIDTRTDAQLWAEHYDRDLADVFAMQTEIAQQIADQLQAKLTPEEKAGITERPTADLVAYALYSEARAIDDSADYWEGVDKPLNREVELLERATQRDRTFALAYCALARTRGDLYLAFWNHEDLELARKAANEAVRLRPDMGETHRELARTYFCASFSAAGRAPAGIETDNFNRAREELAKARRKLPNDSETLLIAARIDRHQNRWESVLAALQKANDLDPRNGEIAF